MSKIKTIEPKGRLSFTCYACDRGGVGHIRTILPFTLLGSWRYKQLSFDPTYLMYFISDPSYYKKQSFVKFQRSATKDQLDMFKRFKFLISEQTKTPMIYEIDDILFDIPKWNFASNYYQQNKPFIEEMLRMVDGVTVSTPFLKKYYSYYNSNISVVKNRLAKCLWGKPKQHVVNEDKPTICYPGSQNHFGIKGRTEEGGDFGKELLNYILKTKKDVNWVFIGGIPEELKNDKDVTYYNWVGYMNYPSFFKSLNVDIGLAPLEINDFNRGKSNLKLLEYSVCGVAGVYTNVEPYKNCELTSDNENSMIDQIQWLIDNPDERYGIWKKDYEKVKKDLFLEDNLLKWTNEHLKLFNQRIKG